MCLTKQGFPSVADTKLWFGACIESFAVPFPKNCGISVSCRLLTGVVYLPPTDCLTVSEGTLTHYFLVERSQLASFEIGHSETIKRHPFSGKE